MEEGEKINRVKSKISKKTSHKHFICGFLFVTTAFFHAVTKRGSHKKGTQGKRNKSRQK